MTIWVWIGFVVLVLAMDLGVFHRKTHAVTVSEAAVWTTTWVILALLFNVGVYWLYEHHILGLGQARGLELRKCRPRNAIEDIFKQDLSCAAHGWCLAAGGFSLALDHDRDEIARGTGWAQCMYDPNMKSFSHGGQPTSTKGRVSSHE